MISQYQTRISQALAQIQDKLDQTNVDPQDPAPNAAPEPSSDLADMEQALSELQSENASMRATIARLEQERAQEAQELETLYVKLADALNTTAPENTTIPEQEDE